MKQNVSRHLNRKIKKLKYEKDLPQSLNLFLLLSSLCFFMMGAYSFYLFMPYIEPLIENIFVFWREDILFSFIHSSLFILEAFFILLTVSLSFPLGLILSIFSLASFFISPSSDYFYMFFRLFLPLLAIISLIMGNKGLRSDSNISSWREP